MDKPPRAGRWKLLARLLSALLLLIAVAALLPLRRVAGDAMAPTLRDGDWIWVLPVAPLRGDVVVLDDPLDPGHPVLRRALTGGETKARVDDEGVRVNGKKVRQKEMGTEEGYKVFQETIWSRPPAVATTWRIRRLQRPVRWSSEPTEVPADHWYLLADDRDHAPDSRNWGPVAARRIQGVVRLRVGPADAWRPAVEWLKGTE
jgi:signal peptidase I